MIAVAAVFRVDGKHKHNNTTIIINSNIRCSSSSSRNNNCRECQVTAAATVADSSPSPKQIAKGGVKCARLTHAFAAAKSGGAAGVGPRGFFFWFLVFVPVRIY